MDILNPIPLLAPLPKIIVADCRRFLTPYKSIHWIEVLYLPSHTVERQAPLLRFLAIGLKHRPRYSLRKFHTMFSSSDWLLFRKIAPLLFQPQKVAYSDSLSWW